MHATFMFVLKKIFKKKSFADEYSKDIL